MHAVLFLLLGFSIRKHCRSKGSHRSNTYTYPILVSTFTPGWLCLRNLQLEQSEGGNALTSLAKR